VVDLDRKQQPDWPRYTLSRYSYTIYDDENFLFIRVKIML